MNKKEVLELVLIGFGIYLCILAASSFFAMIASMTWYIEPSEGDRATGTLYLLANLFRTTFFGFGSWICLKNPEKLTSRFFKSSSGITVITVSKLDVLQVLFQASGIIILYLSISHLITGITMNNLYEGMSLGPNGWEYSFLVLGPPIVEIILGLILVFIPKLVGRLLAGRKK
jgi:hypothetical protein